jgi:hypothetical protein
MNFGKEKREMRYCRARYQGEREERGREDGVFFPVGLFLRMVSGIGVFCWMISLGSVAYAVEGAQEEEAVEAVKSYAHALSTSNPMAVAQQDFVCLLKMLQENPHLGDSMPPSSDPVYSWCWKRLVVAHAQALDDHDRGLDTLWPGKGKLVNFADFKRFLIAETGARQLPPSYFVMEHIGSTAGSVGFTLEPLGTGPLPHASFRVKEEDHVVAVPTTLVRMKVTYPDPIRSPVANAEGQKDWAVPYKKPLSPVKAVVTKWVVLSDLKQHGFPIDTAVLNIPLESKFGTTIPFVIEAGGYMPNTTEWWKPDDNPAIMNSAVIRAQAFPDRRERITLLNRVLSIHPQHQLALEAIARELYEGFLDYGARTHGVEISDKALAQRHNELYWTIQAQTDRMDLSLDMEMGGKAEPTPADYLYRMIPAMETLRDLQPGDFQNRLRLSLAYRWTNDQMTAIMTPQQLLTEVPEDQGDLRARILLELAWSRISKVAWNRHFDDPDIVRGYQEADEAFYMTQNSMDKFTAAYAKAYSLVFRPNRDNQAMLTLLQEARNLYEQLPGATLQSWTYLLDNDTLKGLVQTDPSFQSLLAAK